MSRPLLRTSPILLAVVLLLGTAAPAGAASLADRSSQQSSYVNKQASLAYKINTLTASDKKLSASLAALNAQVKAKQSEADDANSAADAAEASLSATQKDIKLTNAKVNRLKKAMVRRAVDSYTAASDDTLSQLLQSGDMNEMSRRQAVIDQVTAQESNISDQLRAAKQDQKVLYKKFSEEKKEAEDRRATAMSALASVKANRDKQAKLAGAVKARMAGLRKEAAAAAAAEAKINQIVPSGPAGPPPTSASGLTWPVGGPVTSGFGYRWGRLHAGIDISVPIGTPVHAAKGGTCVLNGTMSGYGNVVIIDHGGGFSTLYAHLSRAGCFGSVGQGQVIGNSGNTGYSTGPHVHFETRINGRAVNPMQFL